MLEQLDKTMETAPTPELKEKRIKLRNDLAYINHYPPLLKYLSLFPPEEEEEANKEIRD